MAEQNKHVKVSISNVIFTKMGFVASLYTKVLYFLLAANQVLCHKKINLNIFFKHTSQIESLGLYNIEPNSDSIWALQKVHWKLSFKITVFLETLKCNMT